MVLTTWTLRLPYNAGESERLLGKALLGGYREKVKLATKLSPFHAAKA